MPGLSDSGGDAWLLCSACRKKIGFGSVHWLCSVSTCNRSRTRLVFCSVPCWDSHVATLRHRDSWAVESIAPTSDGGDGGEDGAGPRADAPSPTSTSPASFSSPARSAPPSPALAVRSAPPQPVQISSGSVTAQAGGAALSTHYTHDDVLVVVSKVKKYIRDRSGMNCSDGVVEALGDHVRNICDEAIRAAARDGRKTVLDRDVPNAGRYRGRGGAD